ncbi:MAG TPA: sigma-70 family RNA polymerase sigma factor [Acidimicrobiia bacterium]|nr:sigma-70 family RNA polymerase sigma factor [Acidimicrobiia bacterium]
MAESITTGRQAPSFEDLEPYRSELTGYAYRLLGSPFEAEDAVQESMVRAWRALDRFEGRSALRTWLYRITTNVCFDMLKGRDRRARPMDLGPASSADTMLPAPLPEITWLEPAPDGILLPAGPDPADVAVSRDSVRLAFVAALQHLPSRQRAVLILRDVLRWQANEVAELLDTTVASVNSALQRARATLAEHSPGESDPHRPLDDDQRAFLHRYVDAFERYDLDALVELLHEDVVQSMPPYGMWLRGPEQVTRFFLGTGIGCRGSVVVPAGPANGLPAFGQYKPDPGGGHAPWALQVLEMSGGSITGLNFFLDTERLFPLFGLPLSYEK